MAKIIFLLMVAALVAVVPAKAAGRHANNLNASEQVIKAKDGKSAFKRTMVGTDNTALGEPLPSGMTKDELSTLVLGTHFDKLKKDDLSGLAAVPFPGRPGLFIGAGGLKKYDDANYCNAHVHLSLVIFKIESPHSFSLVAKTTQPLQFDQGKIRVEGKDPSYPEDELVKIDRCPFPIAPEQFAFGIRLAHNVGYAGGFGHAEFLHLLLVEGETIRPIFSTLIYDLQNLAGDWNPDQTRQHVVFENKYTVAISPTMHDGYHDLVVRQSLGGRYKSTYTWDSKSKSYNTSGNDAIVFSDNQ